MGLLLGTKRSLLPGYSATRYFVDATLGNDANDGMTPDNAWQTIGKVNGETFNPGESVLFKRGETWTGTELTISDSGIAGRPIVLGAYGSGARPVLDRNQVGVNAECITVDGDYITIRDLKLQDARQAGIFWNFADPPDSITIDNCEITNCGTGCMIWGDNVLIQNCYIHDLIMVVDDVPPGNDFGAVGVWIYAGDNHTYRYNTFENCRAPSTDFGFDGGAIEWFYAAIGLSKSTYRIHNNLIDSCQGIFETGASAANGTLDDVRIYHNLILNSRHMIVGNSGANAVITSDFRIEHNTFVQTDADADLFGHDTFIFGQAPGAGEMNVRNNIFYIRDRDITTHDGFTHTYNRYYVYDGSSVILTPSTGEEVENPRFTNLGGADFTLIVNSPAVDTGIDLGYDADYAGNPMPVNAVPDIGAYENQAGYSAPAISYIIDIDHEVGDLSEYDATAGGVSATEAAALNGTSWGLNINITDQVADFGQVNLSLPASGLVRHRFYIDPNGLTMANNDEFVILTDDQALIYVRLFYDGADYVLRVTGDDDGGTFPIWIAQTLTDAPHYVEIFYTRASDAVAADGRVQLWIDGVYQDEQYCDNFDKWALVTTYTIGAVTGIDVGTSGVFFIDEWLVNDDGYKIGSV